MANQNLTFWYEHGHGGGYMGSIIVGFFGDFQVIESDNMGSVLIPVKQKNGTAYVEPTALESATDFFKVQELVEKYFQDCRDPEFVAEVVKRKMK